MARLGNIDLIKHFDRGAISGASFTGNLHIHDNKLYNYSTVIAIRYSNGIVLNSSKYSRTTSKIQACIRMYTNVIEEMNSKDFKSLYI